MNVAKCVMLYKGKGHRHISVSPGTGSVLSLELREFWVRVRNVLGTQSQRSHLAGADESPRIRVCQLEPPTPVIY